MKNQYLISLLAGFLLLGGCQKATVQPTIEAPKVEVAVTGNGGMTDRLWFPAVASAAERSRLSFRVAGEVSRVLVKEGDRVRQGDLLAELDPTDYQLTVDNSLARFSVLDSQYRRSQPLVTKGLLAKSQFDEIAAQREIARAELDLARLRLSFTQLQAPMDGVISRVQVEKFENIQVGQQIINIHSTDHVEIRIQLPDALYTTQPKIDELKKVEALVKVPSGREYEARIKEMTTEPDPATGTYVVTLTMPMPADEWILDGMAVEVTTKSGHPGLKFNSGISLPIEAVINADGDALDRENSFVWVVGEDNTVKKQKVLLGNASKTSLQILAGLNQGSRVVTAGLARLRDGMRVEVIGQETNDE